MSEMRLTRTVSHGDPQTRWHMAGSCSTIGGRSASVAGSRVTLARLYQEQWDVGLREEPGTDRVQAK